MTNEQATEAKALAMLPLDLASAKEWAKNVPANYTIPRLLATIAARDKRIEELVKDLAEAEKSHTREPDFFETQRDEQRGDY